MNSYHSLRQQNNRSTFAVVTLALCVLLSATVLFSRLMGFAPADSRHYIPLTKSGGITTVREGHRQSDGTVTFRHAGYHPQHHRLLTAKPSLVVKDDNTVWTGDTNVEIFKVSYERDAATGDYLSQFSVVGSQGEKVIAPGTRNSYTFGLDNTGNVALDYTVTFNAVCEIIEKGADSSGKSNYEIPVFASVSYTKGTTEHYLFGTGEKNEPVTDMVNVKHSGSVGTGKYIPYTLYWEWPFEGDDAADTLLGNKAAELDLENKEIRLTITIKTTAEQSSSSNADTGVPKTGDTSGIELAMTMLVTSSAALMLLLAIPYRRRRDEND